MVPGKALARASAARTRPEDVVIMPMLTSLDAARSVHAPVLPGAGRLAMPALRPTPSCLPVSCANDESNEVPFRTELTVLAHDKVYPACPYRHPSWCPRGHEYRVETRNIRGAARRKLAAKTLSLRGMPPHALYSTNPAESSGSCNTYRVSDRSEHTRFVKDPIRLLQLRLLIRAGGRISRAAPGASQVQPSHRISLHGELGVLAPWAATSFRALSSTIEAANAYAVANRAYRPADSQHYLPL